MAADSGTTIRLGPGTFRGNELLPTGRQIPVALADHIVEPVGLRGTATSASSGKYDLTNGRGSAYFYFRVPEAGTFFRLDKGWACAVGTRQRGTSIGSSAKLMGHLENTFISV